MAALTIDSTLPLLSGHTIPALGFGAYHPGTSADESGRVISHALTSGYRHLDSAIWYNTEKPCSDSIRESGIPRSEVFLTSKTPPWNINYAGAKADIEKSLKTTGLNYIDLYLLHSPHGGKEGRLGAWKALVEAKKEGKIRSIGVSNFGVHHLEELEKYIKEIEDKEGKGAGGEIAVNQIEIHPWCARKDVVDWCKSHGVVVEAWSPLIRNERMDEPVLQELAKKHGKNPGQILIRWSLQKGFVPLPRSVNTARIEQNATLYDFELSKEDMDKLEVDEQAAHPWFNPSSKRD